MNSDSWTATDTIMGQNQLVIKTTGIGDILVPLCAGDGLLTIRLNSRGFKWEHIGTYRVGGKGKVRDVGVAQGLIGWTVHEGGGLKYPGLGSVSRLKGQKCLGI